VTHKKEWVDVLEEVVGRGCEGEDISDSVVVLFDVLLTVLSECDTYVARSRRSVGGRSYVTYTIMPRERVADKFRGDLLNAVVNVVRDAEGSTEEVSISLRHMKGAHFFNLYGRVSCDVETQSCLVEYNDEYNDIELEDTVSREVWVRKIMDVLRRYVGDEGSE